MFKRVLVATDFSRHADRTLECIGEIPGMEEIVLVYVVNGGDTINNHEASGTSSPTTAERIRPLLEEKKKILEPLGIPVKILVEESTDGDVVRGILAAAARERVTLIVMGARGRGFLRSLILGSVSRGVIERSAVNVLIMHFKGEDSPTENHYEQYCRNIFSKVLCPVDFSKPTADILAFLQTLPMVVRVILLHVRSDAEPEPEVSRNLEALKSSLDISPDRVQCLVRSGDTVNGIISVAIEQDVSLILIPRYGMHDYAKNILLGRVAAGVAAKARRPIFIRYPVIHLTVEARELAPTEFFLAELVWQRYHQQKGDPDVDRIFGAFVEGDLAAVARCRRHPDGLEVDGVFVPEDYRNRGYAKKAVQVLVDACGSEPLFMHSTLELVRFYGSFGFVPIPEPELPASIRNRFNFAQGNLNGANVSPMRRLPGR